MKSLGEMEFKEVVEMVAADCLSELLVGGGPGLKSAIWKWLPITEQWKKEKAEHLAAQLKADRKAARKKKGKK